MMPLTFLLTLIAGAFLGIGGTWLAAVIVAERKQRQVKPAPQALDLEPDLELKSVNRNLACELRCAVKQNSGYLLNKEHVDNLCELAQQAADILDGEAYIGVPGGLSRRANENATKRHA
jgi:hypothetical protein